MQTFKVIVCKNGRPLQHAKVEVEFPMGFARTTRTDSDGIAYAKYTSRGKANVYMQKNMALWIPQDRKPSIYSDGN